MTILPCRSHLGKTKTVIVSIAPGTVEWRQKHTFFHAAEGSLCGTEHTVIDSDLYIRREIVSTLFKTRNRWRRTIPVSISSATLHARERLLVKRYAPRPTVLSFARASASSSVSKTAIAASGPNVSSVQMSILGVRPVKIVGG